MWDNFDLNKLDYGMMIVLRKGLKGMVVRHADYNTKVIAYDFGSWDRIINGRWAPNGIDQRCNYDSKDYDIIRVYDAIDPWNYDKIENIWDAKRRTLLFSRDSLRTQENVTELTTYPDSRVEKIIYGHPYPSPYDDLFKVYDPSDWEIATKKLNNNKLTFIVGNDEEEIPYPF